MPRGVPAERRGIARSESGLASIELTPSTAVPFNPLRMNGDHVFTDRHPMKEDF
jgi:hypothetical protein